MKNILTLFAFLIFVSNAFSQAISDGTTATVLSPFVVATKLLEITTVSTLAAVNSTKSLVQSRGIAGKEQLKDELVFLNEAIMSGNVKAIADIEWPGLRELFQEILENEEHMESINASVQTGPVIHRIAAILTLTLLLE